MKLSIGQTIYQAILGNKWIEVDYENSQKVRTHFCVGVKDIDVKQGKLVCDIFNAFKSKEALGGEDLYISLRGIRNARIIDQSFYLPNDSVLKRLEDDKTLIQFLGIDELDNDILRYLSDCYKFDNDPFLRESVMLDGVDIAELRKQRKLKLDDKQFAKLLDVIFKLNSFEAEQRYRYVDLGINSFSIDIYDKQFVVAYYKLNLNFKNKTLHVEDKPTINKSFLIEDRRMSISRYLDMSPDEFCAEYADDDKKRPLIDEIADHFHEGEMVNTRPTIFLVERRFTSAVDLAFESISAMEKEGKMTQPLKAFFGRKGLGGGTKKDPAIVVFDKGKVNIDQLRVVWNSMVNHVTYVQGPPGTGKTETIFNVLLSAYANDKKTLVCSNNNHPINDIARRLYRSFVKDELTNTRTARLPFLRLGNKIELLNAIEQIRKDIAFAQANENAKANEAATNRSKAKSIAAFSELRHLLADFEERSDICERIETLKRMTAFATNGCIADEIAKQISVLEKKKESIPFVTNQDIGHYIVSAFENKTFLDFIHFSSLIRFKKLLSPINRDLRDIAAIEDPIAVVSEFSRYLREDKNLRRLQDIYPIILCTNLSADYLGSPNPHFDLCIMDEAGQCNIAPSMISIVRATDLLLVGDTNQLQPVTVIETAINERLKAKYGIKNEYDYMSNSILSTMKAKDSNSKSIMLTYHYRCGKKIAGFSNQRFYDGQLKLENLVPGELIYCDVKINNYKAQRNSYFEEAAAVVELIEKNHYKDVGIVTPFVNQAALINEMLCRRGITDVSAGTIHTLQGSEKGTIIFSAAISPRTGKKTMDWIKNNHELINVGVTRAKQRLIFVGDKAAIDAHSKNEVNDIKALSDYVASQGEYAVPKIEDRSFANFSNDSTSEREFFDTVAPYFNKRRNKFRIERNVPVRKAIAKIHPNDLTKIGQKEFDLIVQVNGALFGRTYRTLVVFEIDGGEHVGSKATAMRDRVKESICKTYGIKLIRIANNQVKDYETIIALFECIIKGIADIDEVYQQGSLFSEENIDRAGQIG